MGRRPHRDAAEADLIVVDTSAWVELLRDTGSPTQRALENLIEAEADLAITEIVVAELLAGARSASVRPLRSRLLAYELIPLNGLQDFERAALLYRECVAAGADLRTLTDCLVAVPAINQGAELLHNDADFDTIARHSDLTIYEP